MWVLLGFKDESIFEITVHVKIDMKSAFEKVLLLSGASALAGAALVLSGTALVVRSWSQSPDTVVRTNDFAWSAKAFTQAKTIQLVQDSFSQLNIEAIEIANLDSTIAHVRAKIRRAANARQAELVANQIEIARLEGELAAPAPMAATQAQDELVVAQASSNEELSVTSDEMKQMLNAYRSIHQEYLVELYRVDPVPGVMVATESAPVRVNTQVEVVQIQAPVQIKPIPRVLQAQIEMTPVSRAKAAIKKVSAVKKEVVRTIPAAPTTQVAEVMEIPLPPRPVVTQPVDWETPLDLAGDRLASVDEALKQMRSPEPAPESIQVVDAASAVRVQPRVLPAVMAPPPAEIPVVTTQSAPALAKPEETGYSVAAVAPAPVQVRVEYPRLPTATPPQAVVKQPESVKEAPPSKGSASVARTSFDGASATPTHVEAFEETQAIAGVTTESITHEQDRSWVMNSKHGYWPTLNRGEVKAVPLISEANLRLMGWAAASQIHSDAGVVFGTVPAGYEVSFSGRSETGLYLSRDKRWLSGGVSSEERHFVFLNAAPGAHLLHITAADGSGSGAVLVPVLPGVATRIQIGQPQFKRLTGTVLDAGDRLAAGLPGARVRVLGHRSSEGVLAGAKGVFSVARVLVVSNHPVLVETDMAEGFTHRYQISPERMDVAALFRMRETQIESWIGQLEGGVSPESGLIIAAVPEELAAAKTVRDLPYQPSIRTLGSEGTLKPETYTIAPNGTLEVSRELDSATPRFLGAQIPEGAVITEFGLPEKPATWSQLQVTSPRVINVVGGL